MHDLWAALSFPSWPAARRSVCPCLAPVSSTLEQYKAWDFVWDEGSTSSLTQQLATVALPSQYFKNMGRSGNSTNTAKKARDTDK